MFQLGKALITTKTFLACLSVSLIPINSSALALENEEEAQDYVLMADGGSAIERVNVVGGKLLAARIPGSATYISEEELEKFNHSDIHRILRQVPGVNIQEEDGFGLRPNIGIRGTGSERSSRITLMEDGVLIAPAPYAAPAAYYFPTAGRLAGVEVRKGSSAIKFGPRTIGGAVNLISTPVPMASTLNSISDLTGFVNMRAGQNGFFENHAAIGGASEQFGFLLEGFHSHSDGFKELPSNDDTGYVINDIVGKLKFSSSATADIEQSLELKIGYVDQESDETYLGLTDEDFEVNPFARYAASEKDNFTSEHFQLQATHFMKLNADADVTSMVYYNKFERDWFKLDDLNFDDGRGRIRPSAVFADPTNALNIAALEIMRGNADSVDDALQLRHNAREYYSFGVQTIVALGFNGDTVKHDVEFGLRYHEDEENRQQNRENFAMRDGSMVLTSVGAPTSHANRLSSAKAWAFFVQDEISFGELRVIPGLRYESIDLTRYDFEKGDVERINGATRTRETSYDVLIPGVGVAFDASPELTLIAGVHKGFSPPSPGKLDALVEESVNYEAGFRYANNGLNFEVVGFVNDYANLLGTCTNATGCGAGDIGDQFNGGEAKVVGLEFKADYSFRLSNNLWMPLSVNYNYTDGSFSSDFSDGFWGDVAEGDQIPYVAEHQLFVALGFETNKFSLNTSINIESDVRNVAGSGAIDIADKIPARAIVDVNLSYQVQDNVKLFVSAENAFDKTYIAARRPYGLRPGKPQTLLAGISFNF